MTKITSDITHATNRRRQCARRRRASPARTPPYTAYAWHMGDRRVPPRRIGDSACWGALSMALSSISKPPSDVGTSEGLPPIGPPKALRSAAAWAARAAEIDAHFRAFLGEPAETVAGSGATTTLVDEWELPWGSAKLFSQPNGLRSRQLVLLLAPPGSATSGAQTRPGAVVPFYHPDESAGIDLRSTRVPSAPPRNSPDDPMSENETIAYGRHLVDRGFIVACVEAFPFNQQSESQADAETVAAAATSTHPIWQVATDKLLRENPRWTGMGKLTHDVRLATDLLLEQPAVDPTRVLCIGHSLGGKMAFYAGCLDERIGAVIASDFGIGFSFTNWEADWYLGPPPYTNRGTGAELSLGHHHLLALMAPRPFLLIGGEFDDDRAWQYLEMARPAYDICGAKPSALGFHNHAAGHRPPSSANEIAYRWLGSHFGEAGKL